MGEGCLSGGVRGRRWGAALKRGDNTAREDEKDEGSVSERGVHHEALCLFLPLSPSLSLSLILLSSSPSQQARQLLPPLFILRLKVNFKLLLFSFKVNLNAVLHAKHGAQRHFGKIKARK